MDEPSLNEKDTQKMRLEIRTSIIADPEHGYLFQPQVHLHHTHPEQGSVLVAWYHPSRRKMQGWQVYTTAKKKEPIIAAQWQRAFESVSEDDWFYVGSIAKFVRKQKFVMCRVVCLRSCRTVYKTRWVPKAEHDTVITEAAAIAQEWNVKVLDRAFDKAVKVH